MIEKPSKVWVVAQYYDHEGYSEPEKAFLSKENADAWIKRQTKAKYVHWTVIEVEVE